jgi:hypothetical protein
MTPSGQPFLIIRFIRFWSYFGPPCSLDFLLARRRLQHFDVVLFVAGKLAFLNGERESNFRSQTEAYGRRGGRPQGVVE